VTVEYIIVGAVLFVGGALQRWLRLSTAADEPTDGPAPGWWTVVLGWAAMLLGIILLAAGVAGR